MFQRTGATNTFGKVPKGGTEMPRIDFIKTTKINRTPRVMQVEGLFDVPPTECSEEHFVADMEFKDDNWHIGLIVGPSGSGKTTLAKHNWPWAYVDFRKFAWPMNFSILDAFPREMSVKVIVELLCSVGFSSPPSWLRPFDV